VPTLSKLKAYLQYQRLVGNQEGALGIGVTPKRLLEFAQAHTKEMLQESMGENFTEDTAYVLDFREDDFLFESEHTKFIVMIVTDRLLNFPPEPGTAGSFACDTICLDETFGTNWHNFSVIPLIIQDATRVSHIMAMVLASHHDAWVYEKICGKASAARPNLFASVRYVSADGAQAISNGARAALGLALLWIMCWMHVYIKNFMVALQKVPELPDGPASTARKKKLSRVHMVFKCAHQAQSELEFVSIARVFLETFVTNETDVAVRTLAQKSYDSWLSEDSPRRHFYAGAAPLRITNNCGPESMNKQYKARLLTKAPLNMWWVHTQKFVESHSAERRPDYVNQVIFGTTIKVDGPFWLQGNLIASSARRWATGRADDDDSMLIVPVKHVPDDTAPNGMRWLDFSYDNRIPGSIAGAAAGGPMVDYCDSSWKFLVFNKNDPPEALVNSGGGALTWEDYTQRARQVLLKSESAEWMSWKEVHEYYSKLSIVRLIPDEVSTANPAHLTEATFGGYWCQCENCTREKVCECVIGVRIFLGEVKLPAEYAQFGKQKKTAPGAPSERHWTRHAVWTYAGGSGNGLRF